MRTGLVKWFNAQKGYGFIKPVDGGFDSNGNITKNPAEILRAMLPMPAGYWKGSALSIVLDILGAALSGGNPAADMNTAENELSQVFLAISMADPEMNYAGKLVKQTAEQFSNSPGPDGKIPRYPGQLVPGMRETRKPPGA